MLNVLSLFSGIGAFEVALNEENIEWKLDHYCEIDKYASKSYNMIHGTTDEDNLKDVVSIDYNKIGSVDLITYGFPCVIGNTLVNTQSGLTEISNLDVGDKVLSHDGTYRYVNKVMYQGKKKIYVVKGLCFDRIEATENHLFYASKKRDGVYYVPDWIPCKDLRAGDCVGVPIDACFDHVPNIRIADDKIIIEDRKIAYKISQSLMKKYKKAICVNKVGDNYELSLDNENRSYYRDGFLWYQIEYIAETDRVEDVYDIEVEGAHSFVANNCIIHNCQDISIAGRGRGFVDEEGNITRSGLFFNAADVIRHTKPKFAIFENVKNLTGKKFEKEFSTVLNTLDELGYNTYWKVLNAKDHGCPQNRERVIGVSIRKDVDRGYKFPDPVPLDLRLKDVLEENVDEKFYLSDEQVQKLLENCNALGTNEKNEAKINMIGLLDIKGNEQVRRVYGVDGISPTLNTMQGGNRQPKILLNEAKDIGEPVICAVRGRYIKNDGSDKRTLQNLEINQSGCSNTLTSVQKDNYVLEPKMIQRSHGYNKGGEKELCPSITTSAFQENNFVKENKIIIDDTQGFDGTRIYDEYSPSLRASRSGLKTIDQPFRIRKITPREAWRLMGFADEYFDRVKGVSNTQLFKQAGNSIVVNILRHVFRELQKQYPEYFEQRS